jgi:hypothetical protein
MVIADLKHSMWAIAMMATEACEKAYRSTASQADEVEIVLWTSRCQQ